MVNNFIKNNWRACVFPITCSFIFLIDRFLDLPIIITIVKICIFSLFHALYVYRTRYVYNSDIYIYLSNLKAYYEENHVIKPIFTHFQSSLIFWSWYILMFLYRTDNCNMFLFSIHAIITVLLFVDIFNTILRSFFNTANLSKVKTPQSLIHVRFMFKFLTRISPHCIALGKFTITGLAATEIFIPDYSGPNVLGPVTKFYANNIAEYAGEDIPVQTRYDFRYEEHKVFCKTLIRPEGEMPPPNRTCSLKNKQDLIDLGLPEDIIEGIMASSNPFNSSSKK